MQMRRAPLLRVQTQAFAQLLRAWRSGEQTLEQGSQIQPRAPCHNRQIAALCDLVQRRARTARVIACGKRFAGRDNIEQMMGSKGSFFP